MVSARRFFHAASAASLSFFIGSAALAQGPITLPSAGGVPLPQIMVVDVERILSQAKAMKSLQSQYDALVTAFKKEQEKTESELQATKLELAKEQGVLSLDAFNEKRLAYEKRLAEYQKDAQLKERSVRQGAQVALGQVQAKLLEIVRDIAEKRHSNLVMQRSQLMVVDPAYEVTAEAYARLDQEMPDVKVVPAKPTDAPPVPGAPAAPAPQTAAKKK
jgi:outer membrane protein